MGLAKVAYQPSVAMKTAVAEALKVSSSQQTRAASERPADGVGRYWSEVVAFMGAL